MCSLVVFVAHLIFFLSAIINAHIWNVQIITNSRIILMLVGNQEEWVRFFYMVMFRICILKKKKTNQNKKRTDKIHTSTCRVYNHWQMIPDGPWFICDNTLCIVLYYFFWFVWIPKTTCLSKQCDIPSFGVELYMMTFNTFWLIRNQSDSCDFDSFVLPSWVHVLGVSILLNGLDTRCCHSLGIPVTEEMFGFAQFVIHIWVLNKF